MSAPRRYSVVVAKDYLKFAAAHFIAYPGFREPLHGHNYQVSVRVEADLGPDGYVLDVRLLPIAHSSAEELAAYLLARLRDALRGAAGGRGLAALEVGVAEAPGQAAYCRETC